MSRRKTPNYERVGPNTYVLESGEGAIVQFSTVPEAGDEKGKLVKNPKEPVIR